MRDRLTYGLRKVGAGAAVALASLLLAGCAPAETPMAPGSPDALAKTLAMRSLTQTEPALARESLGSLQMRASAYVDHAEDMAWIGAHSTSPWDYAALSSWQSYHALALSTRISGAVGYVRHLPAALLAGDTSNELPLLQTGLGTGLPYTGGFAAGSAPILFQWDERWGYKDYCGDPLGLTGCGVTVASMAYMGITGRTDITPAGMAALATRLGEAKGGTNSTLFTNPEFEATTGMDGTRLRDNVTALADAAGSGALVALSVKPNTLASGGHWVLVVGLNADGTLSIHDPNSPANTARSWDPAKLMEYENAMIALRPLE